MQEMEEQSDQITSHQRKCDCDCDITVNNCNKQQEPREA